MYLYSSLQPLHLLSYKTSTRVSEVQVRSFGNLVFTRKNQRNADQRPKNRNVAFYTDFSKTSDINLRFELIQKVAQIREGECLLEIVIHYLKNDKQFVKNDNCSSRALGDTIGASHGSPFGPMLVCIFINDLPEVVVFSEAFILRTN